MHLKESAYNFIYDDLGKDQIVFYNSRLQKRDIDQF